MVNSKDRVEFLVQITFFFNLKPFLFRVRGDLRARPRYADADSANFARNFRGQEIKKFLNDKKNPHAKF